MNHSEKHAESVEPLKLVGEQIILTSRSDQTVSGSSSYRNCRPHSAALSRRVHTDHKPKCSRPKSAESKNSSLRNPVQWHFSLNEPKVDERSSISVSHFTDSSSRLLHDLLETPGKGEANPCPENLQKNVGEKNARDALPDYFSLGHVNISPGYSKVCSKEISESEGKEENLESLKVQQWLPEVAEEKSVRFMATQMEEDRERVMHHRGRCLRRDFVHHHCHHAEKNLHRCWRNEYESPREERHVCRGVHHFESHGEDHRRELESRARVGFVGDESSRFRGHNQSNDSDYQVEGNNEPDTWLDFEKSLGGVKDEVEPQNLEAPDEPRRLDFSNKEEDDPPEGSENLAEYNSSDTEVNETLEVPQQCPQVEKESAKPRSPFPNVTSDSTYEEMVRLLQTLEEEDSGSLHLESKGDSKSTSPVLVGFPEGKIDHLSAVYSYLEEVEKEDEDTDQRGKDVECSQSISSPRLEDLLNKNSVELAHEVLSLRIQVEDQRKGIKLLRETLAEMKEEKKTAELEHQEAVHRATTEAEALVHRHQKFIKQLLNEKKSLNETVSKLVQDLKSSEERYKRNIKAMEEKHVIEVKRAKEAQAVADKIKREKWMETKTRKIKEMTVKGLEPELSRMAVRQQEEMTELRNLHRAELEAVELRAARRSSDLMDELRAELTKEKEHAIGRETAALRVNMEKEFEEERNKLQNYCQSLKERLRREEEKLSNREMEFHQKLVDYKQEAERERQKLGRDHQEKLEEVRRRHLVELKNLRESLEAEKEIWANNYKKQQAAKFFEKETELHQQYKRERDRDIELIIETLEKESAQIQLELNVAGENKLKRLKDTLEAEIKELETSEAALKGKLSEAKSQLLTKDDFIAELNSQIRQLHAEMTFLRKSCEEMTSERANLRELIRAEFESSLGEAAKEREVLEKEMKIVKETHLKELSRKDQLNLQAKNEMQKELARVYSRFKSAVSKKEKIIESLREENRGSAQRCQQLELMLDRQRRNLLL